MSPSQSVTQWLGELQVRDHEAARKLWDRYFEQLVRVARVKLGRRFPVADEEDVALSAFASFCRGAEDARFPNLNDRDGLWALLVTITVRKALKEVAYEGAIKRDPTELAQADLAALAQKLRADPRPDDVCQWAEDCERLLDMLKKEPLRQIALGKLEGKTHAEIAKEINTTQDAIEYTEDAIEYKVKLIRAIWQAEEKSTQ